MAVKIWNRAMFRLVVPGVGGRPLGVGEAMVYPDAQYDALVNTEGVRRLLIQKYIKIQNLDDMDVQFADAWNETPHLTLGTTQYWIDSTGVTRLVDGTPTSDTDGEPVGSGGVDPAVPIYSDTMPIYGRTFGQMRSSFFNAFHNKAMGTWDTLYKYCYWSLGYTGGPWTPYQKFDTQDDFFTWMETVIPSVGGVYDVSALSFRTEERIDPSDSFPQKLIHRNSLMASILGKYKYNTRRQAYGVSSAFNAPQYYTNYYGELAQRFVQEDTGALPSVNEDGAIWHTLRTRSKHGLPQVGSFVDVNLNMRGAAWDASAVSWVSPAPPGNYVVQAPFLLIEWRRRKVLQIMAPPDAKDWGLAATEAVSAIVFPVVLSGRWRAYVMYPYSYDSFVTEKFDLSTYELVMKLVYRNTSRPQYEVLPDPWYTVGDDGEHTMWSHWKVVTPAPLWLESVLARRAPGSTGRNVDANTFPDKVFVARRNKSTGVRSSWYPLYSIKRRIPYAPYRIMPAQYPY